MTISKELPFMLSTKMNEDSFRRAVLANMQALAGEIVASEDRVSALVESVNGLEIPEQEHEDDEDDPTQVTGARFHAFHRHDSHEQSNWMAHVRFDELTNDNFQVKRYKVRLWEWDPTTGDRAKYPTGHAKAGEYKPSRPKNVEALDDDGNTWVDVEFGGLTRRKWYVVDARAISKHGRRGAWSALSAPGSASDTTAPPAPLNVTIDVDPHTINGDWDADRDVDDTEVGDGKRLSNRIAYFQTKVTTDTAGNNVVTKTNGKKLFDPYVKSSKKRFWYRRPRGNYYFHVRSVDGSGNKSEWVRSSAGNKKDPPAPGNAPSIDFDQGGRQKVRMVVGFEYNETFTDDDIVGFQVRAQIDGRYKYNFVSIDQDGAEDNYYETTFRGIREGVLCKAWYRPRDKAGNESPSWSPVAQATAYDVVGSTVPANVTVTAKKLAVVLDWAAPTTSSWPWSGASAMDRKLEVSHYEAEAHTNSSFTALYDKDYHIKATRKRFDRERGQRLYCRVRVISKGGTAGPWVTTGGADASGVAADDLEDRAISQSRLLPSGSIIGARLADTFVKGAWFNGGAYGSSAAGTQNLGDVTAGTFTGGLIRTDTSGTRIQLSGGADKDKLAIYGSTNRKGYFSADSGDIVLKLENGADFVVEGGNLEMALAPNFTQTSASAGTEDGFINILVNGSSKRVKYHNV